MARALVDELEALTERMRRAGMTLESVLAAQEEAVRAAFAPTLTPAMLRALRTPFQKESTQLIEQLEADCLAASFGWQHAAGRKKQISFDAPETRRRNPDVVYVTDINTLPALVRAVEDQVFLSATQHNLGGDIIYFDTIDADNRTADVAIVQQKVGATMIGASTSANNANRSMVAIADKLHALGRHVKRVLEVRFQLEVGVRYELHTTSTLRASARRVATDRDITVYNADMLWDSVWSDDVKAVLRGLYRRNCRRLGAPA